MPPAPTAILPSATETTVAPAWLGRWPARALIAIAVVATLAPVVVVARAVALYARNFPWWDQWGLIAWMVEVTGGRLPLDALWVQVNEHRIPVALLLQGAVAWWTRWDVRGDAWTNVGLGVGSLLALVGLARRSLVGPAALASSPIFAALVFSPIASTTWTAAWTTPTFAATFFATLTARLAAGAPSWPRLAAMTVAAGLGALSFGSGLVLLVLLPAVWLAMPGTPPRRRAAQTLVALAAAVALVGMYFVGWYPRWGVPPPVFHPDRASEYVAYVLAYVGGATGPRDIATAWAWGRAMLVAAAVAIVLLWWRAPSCRPALVPWTLLVLYALGAGCITAYGRLDDGRTTAMLPRYVPTAGLFAVGVTAIVALAVTEVHARSRLAAAALAVVLVFPLAAAARRFADAARGGLGDIAIVSRRIDVKASCLRACATATDACLAGACWDVGVARRLCPLMERARIGPFRAATVEPRIASDRPSS
jgi:hypothetical protein